MKLIIYNGSPRGKKSNTKLLMDKFLDGLNAQEHDYEIETYYLASRSQRREGVLAFPFADKVILAFPLYTDSMPGIVKEFIDQLQPWIIAGTAPDMGFVIQSGFPEPAHLRYIERYVKLLASRLGAKYSGAVIKSGVEGIQVMPRLMTRKLYRRFYMLGKFYSKNGCFDPEIIRKMTPFENFNNWRIWLFNRMNNTKMANFYWDNQLKANGVYEQRFARPSLK